MIHLCDMCARTVPECMIENGPGQKIFWGIDFDPSAMGEEADKVVGCSEILYLGNGKPKVVCLCGSTRFRDAWAKAYREESLKGNIVLSVGVMLHEGEEPIQEDSPEKELLDELHLRKIDMADEVLVLNVGGYIGKSTAREMEYAKLMEKPIRLLE